MGVSNSALKRLNFSKRSPESFMSVHFRQLALLSQHAPQDETAKPGKVVPVNDENDDVTIVFLGTGDSGKTTLYKQLLMMHEYDAYFHQHELILQKSLIRYNVIEGFQALIFFLVKKDKSFKEEYSALVESISSLDPSSPQLNEYYTDCLKAAWSNQKVKEAYDNKDALGIDAVESLQYFMNALDRIWSSSYKPTAQDMLRARTRTCGIIESKLLIKGVHRTREVIDEHESYSVTEERNLDVVLIDTGGERNERKKWNSIDLTSTTYVCIVFVVSVSEFDQVLFEDNNTLRQNDSLELFQSIIKSKRYNSHPVVLLLNKVDVLKQKNK